MQPHTIFTSIRPTGVLHLGKYIGAIQQFISLQDNKHPETTLLCSIADLHALASGQSPNTLRRWKRETLASLLAIGIDPNRTSIFFQSMVPAQVELIWILGCSISAKTFTRMAGFEWKYPDMGTLRGQGNINDVHLGVLSSPLLRAVEMLIYRTTHIPSGYEQGLIVDLAYQVAGRFNSKHGPVLVCPTQLIAWFETITSFTHPTQKMSSVEASRRSSISIVDTPKEIESKVSSAVTDKIYGVSYEPEDRPGVSNFLEILAGLEQVRGPGQLVDEYAHISHSELKKMVSHAIINEFQEARERYQDLVDKDDSYFDNVVVKGAEIAQLRAEGTLRMVKSELGL